MEETRPSKWSLHWTILGVVGVLVAFGVALLFSDSHAQHGLDGLGEALLGGMLVLAFGAHALVSTIVVALVRDRAGVTLAHLAGPTAVVLVLAAMFTVR